MQCAGAPSQIYWTLKEKLLWRIYYILACICNRAVVSFGAVVFAFSNDMFPRRHLAISKGSSAFFGFVGWSSIPFLLVSGLILQVYQLRSKDFPLGSHDMENENSSHMRSSWKADYFRYGSHNTIGIWFDG